MKKWSEQPSLLDTDSALQLAENIFHNLGYKDEDFEAPICSQYMWQPYDERPKDIRPLPAFKIAWLQKGATWNGIFSPTVEMRISGTTKRVVVLVQRCAFTAMSLAPKPISGPNESCHADGLRPLGEDDMRSSKESSVQQAIGGFFLLCFVASARADYLYVSNDGNNTIMKFDSNGNGTVFADASSGLDKPQGLALDSSGNLYVANHRERHN